MAGNSHEGLGDEFFEQILAGTPGSYPIPMPLQLNSGGVVGGGGGGMGGGMPPLGLNLEQSGGGSGFRDDVGGNSTSNHSLLISWQMENGLVHNMTGSLFPAFGQLQPPPLRQAPPPLPQLGGPALHQPFQSQQSSGPISTAPNPPPIRPRIRARRGQATDPHSIAERLRRERIAERMKALQELVPSCNKTDRAAMLDEIVDYVKFLRLQVKVLSMSRLGGAGAVAQLVSDVPLSSIEGESVEGGTYPPAWDKWSTDGTEHQVAKLMEEDVGAAMQFLQSKALCIMPISLASTIFHTSPSDQQLLIKPESGNP